MHRAEILQLAGSWPDALEEARRGLRPALVGRPHPSRGGAAFYQRAELHRLHGDVGRGRGGLPGRPASGGGRPARTGPAAAGPGPASRWRRAIRQVLEASARTRSAGPRCWPRTSRSPWPRGDVAAARAAADELAAIADGLDAPYPEAVAAHARARSSWPKATPVAALRRAANGPGSLAGVERPYEAARSPAPGRPGLPGARRRRDRRRWSSTRPGGCSQQLGAAPDLARLERARRGRARRRPPGPDRRESRRCSRSWPTGRTNRVIAAEL